MNENPWALLEEKGDGAIPTATLQIYQFIEKYLEREKDSNVNRCSAATMCVKRRWYQHHGYEATPLTPRKIVNFLLGDLTERVLLYFIKEGLVGAGKIYSQVDFGEVLGTIQFQGRDIEIYSQKDLTFKLPDGTPITGHADGFGVRGSDNRNELIEIKSAASYGFDEFKKNGPGDYLKQAHALMMTEYAQELGVTAVRFYYLSKETGHLYDRVYDYQPSIAKLVRKEFLIAKGTEEPNAPYGFKDEMFRGKPTGKTTVDWRCGYCSYLTHCKPGFTKEFKSGKPKFYWEKKNEIQ